MNACFLKLGDSLLELHDATKVSDAEIQNMYNSGGYSVAINAEKLIAIEKNIELQLAVENASLRVVDGASLSLLSKLKGGRKLPKVNMPAQIIGFAKEYNYTIDIVGSTKSTNARAVRNLQSQLGELVLGGIDGYASEQDIIDYIDQSNADIILLGLGSPKQELLSNKLCTKPKRIVINCGGAIKVLAGEVKSAPDFVANSYFEWLYRLMLEPKKIFRIFSLIKNFSKLLKIEIIS